MALLGSETGKLVAAVGKSGLEKGIKAGNTIEAAAKASGGRSGGKPDLAHGVRPNVAKLDEEAIFQLSTYLDIYENAL